MVMLVVYVSQSLVRSKARVFSFCDIIPLSQSFCSTSLPLTSTRWVGSTIILCTVYSLNSVLSINLINIKFFFEKIGNA